MDKTKWISPKVKDRLTASMGFEYFQKFIEMSDSPDDLWEQLDCEIGRGLLCLEEGENLTMTGDFISIERL